MFTRFKARITRVVASLTAVTLLVGTAAIGVAAPAAADVDLPGSYGVTVGQAVANGDGSFSVPVSGQFPEEVSGSPVGVYGQWCYSVTDRDNKDCSAGQSWWMPVSAYGQPTIGSVVDGVWSFETTVNVPAVDAGEGSGLFVRLDHRHSHADKAVFDKFYTVTFPTVAPGDGDDTDNGEGTDKPEEPKEEDVVQQQAGTFAWGFKESFRNYIKGNIAHGEVQVANGAVDDGDFYTFQQESNSVKDGKGTVSYTGSVQFTGHDGDLDSKFSNPQIKLTSANAGEISFEVNSLNLDDSTKNLTGQRVVVAQFTGAKLTTNKDESVSYMASNVTLTADGSRAFSNFYQAGDALDAITFTIGANKSELPETDKPGTDTGTDTPGTGTDLPSTGAVAAKKAGTYKQAKVDETSLVPGGRFTITADGFGANTKDIELYVYSEPVLLKKNIAANANGVVTVTATLPENLPAGTHTLSLEAPNGVIQQVSIEVLAVDAIDESDEEETDPKCVAREISGATLSWGVKQSYVNYVSRLSDGKITTSGVTQSGDAFLWSGGTGKYNEETSKGLARFGGSLNFTGHAGIMDTTFRNVRVQFHGTNSASIVADIVSNSVEGETSSANAVYLATISLAGNKSVSGNKVTWSNAPVTLTAAGANAFGGFYEAGQAMDPATVSITLGAETDCDTASGTALGNTGVEGIQAGLAAAIFLLLAGTVAVIANRRYTVQQR